MYKTAFFSSSFLILLLISIFAFKQLIPSKHENLPDSSDKIPLHKEMVINESALGEAWRLIDEQKVVGDPKAGSGKSPKTSWKIDWNKKDYFPVSAVIDLGNTYRLSNIYLYDAEGTGRIEISTGKPFSWSPVINEGLNKYNIWKNHEVDLSTRFIQIKYYDNVSLPEIVLYGAQDKEKKDNLTTPAATKNSHLPKLTMDKFMGVNAFVDDPLDKLKAVGFVREYHVWGWDEGDNQAYKGYPQNKNAWNPSYAGGGGWHFDNYYRRLRDAGITISTCIQESPKWLNVPADGKPVPKGRNPMDPLSYKEHADHMFQAAARYGSTKVPDALLKLAETEPRLSGLDLIQYYENWNEPDKDWKTRKEHFSPYEYAAMASADYDGHRGKLGKTFGVKNADPNAKLVMGGISALNLDYIKAIRFWSDWNRGGNVPFDVINLHHYSNDGGRQRSIGKVGISPEEDSLKQKLEKFVAYRNNHMPGKEIWITEFGYDTHKNSVQRAPAIGNYSMEEVQAIWLIRSYMAIAAAGVDRAAMYMLRDTESNSGTLFNNSGLTGKKSAKHPPKTSWYYVYTLKKQLTGKVFTKDLSTEKVMIYKFRDITNDTTAYVLWLPSSRGAVLDNFTFSVPDNEKIEKIIEFEDKSVEGNIIDASTKQTNLKLTIEEKPKIIIGSPNT